MSNITYCTGCGEYLGDKIADEIALLRARLATAGAERDAAHNEALEKAAGVILRQIPELEAEHGASDIMVLGMRQDIDAIRALKKETPNADK